MPDTIPDNAIIIDVRTDLEHKACCLAKRHEHWPLDRLERDRIPDISRDVPVYVLCRTGARAQKGAAYLRQAGFHDVRVIEGGLEACRTAGLAMIENNSIWSLERQVRIAAGLLVAGGTLAGLLISPVWFAIPLFVGGGLVFAGITDRCGMALALAKAPWNR